MHWGLKGKDKEISKIKFSDVSEMEKEIAINALNVELPFEERNTNALDIRKRYGAISENEYQMALAVITDDRTGKYKFYENEHKFEKGEIDELTYRFNKATLEDDKEELLSIKYEKGEIDGFQYNKELATLKGEPYIEIINTDYDPKLVLDGFRIEFDWNDIWIKQLHDNGYVGEPDEVVEQWFKNICRGVLMSDYEYAQHEYTFNSNVGITEVRNDQTQTIDYS